MIKSLISNKLYFILLTFMLLYGCSEYPSWIFGVDNSGFKNQNEIKQYLHKRHIDNKFAAIMDSAYIDSMLNEKFCLDTMKRKNFCPLEIRFYNSNGRIIGGWETCLGSPDLHQCFDTFPFVSKLNFPLNNKINILTDLQFLKLDNKEEFVKEASKHKYIMLVMWGKNMGIFSKKVLKKTREYLQKYADKNILLITCNFDI